MAITLLCPRLRCRAILRVPDSVRGKQVRCGECGMAFLVPEAPPKPAPVAPPPPAEGPVEKTAK